LNGIDQQNEDALEFIEDSDNDNNLLQNKIKDRIECNDGS
jgi:hypothetical protein